MSLYQKYFSEMQLHGESYAALFYIIASVILAASGLGLSHIFDSISGIIWVSADIIILMLKFFDKAESSRNYLLFFSSFLGLIFLLIGGVSDELFAAEGRLDIFFAFMRVFANILLLIASGIAFIRLKYPSFLKTQKVLQSGRLYIVANSIFLIFFIQKFYVHMSLPSFGYVLTAVLWLLASNAIRIKFDCSSKVLS